MHHVILGAGPAGVVAAETLRHADPQAGITLVSAEYEQPYSRMAIPYVLTGKVDETGTYLRRNHDHFRNQGIQLAYGRVCDVRTGSREVKFQDGSGLSYDRLLIATGGRPVRPRTPGLDVPGVHNCWTLQDARDILKLAHPGAHVVLMGAGFIGCIILEALVLRGVSLTVIETGDRMVPRMMNATAGAMLKRWCEIKGVTVLTGTSIAAMCRRPVQPGDEDTIDIELSGGNHLKAHLVVVAAGVKPNTDFLGGSGIALDRGVLVDECLRTNVEGIFAAGDVAQGKDRLSGLQDVHAIQPTATEHGRVAALNMAGQPTPYLGSVQMNVLDTLGLISASFGQWMGVASGEGVERLDERDWKYISLQFREDMLVGATAIGLTRHVGVLRGLIQSRTRLGPWKDRLLADPTRIAEAFVARSVAACA